MRPVSDSVEMIRHGLLGTCDFASRSDAADR